MPPKRKKPEASIPKGCEVVSVSQVEAGVKSHVYESGSGKTGTNVTEKDKVDFLCLLRQMSVSSEGNGNRSNSGMQTPSNPQASHDLTIAHTDITSWCHPSTAAQPTSKNSPEWEYVNFQDLLNASKKDQSASQRSQGQDIKCPWPENLQSNISENTILKGPDQLMSQSFPKPQEMTWPAPPGLQQTKFVRQPMAQPQLPMPNFPHTQHQQLQVNQGMMPQARSPFSNIPLPQHPLGVNLQHQFTQPQLIPHSMQHQPRTPESPIMPSPPGIGPNSNPNPLNQSGLFMTHPGMAQPWRPSAMLSGQVQTQAQHTLGITAEQPFLPVGTVVSPRSVAVNQQDVQFRLQQLQQTFPPLKQVGLEQPWSIKDQVPNNQQIPNPQIRPPPGLLNQNFPLGNPNPKHENTGSSKFPGWNESHQARPRVPNSAQTQQEIHELLGSLALKTGLHSNSTLVQQSNKAGLVPNPPRVQQSNEGGLLPNPVVQQSNKAGLLPNPPVVQQSNKASVLPNPPVAQQSTSAGRLPDPTTQQTNLTGSVPNATVVQQTNKVVKNQHQMDSRNNKQVKINGAEPRGAGRQMMDILKAALNYIDFRRGVPFCIPCQRSLREEDITPHLKNVNHRDMIEVHDIRVTCNDMPKRREFFDVLTEFLEKEYNKLRITDAQMYHVNEVILRLNSMLQHCCESHPEEVKKNLSASCIRLYGSIATRMALKEDVKINLDLNVPNVTKEVTQKFFLDVVKALEESDSFRDVKHVMADSYSAVTFMDLTSNLPVALSLNNVNPYRLSQLILNYGNLDERVVKLGVLFRAWGKLCKVDNPDDSAFLPHAFPMLVIHFMQKLKVIPVLHEMTEKKNDANAYLDSESAAKMFRTKDVSLGELWVRLFHFYLYEHDVSSHVVCITQSRPFSRKDTNWRARRIAIIDPFQPKRNVACHVSQVMSRYIDECFLFTFLHYAIPQTVGGPAFGSIRRMPQWLAQNFSEIFVTYQQINDLVLKIVLSTEPYGPPRSDSALVRENLRNQLAQIPIFKYLFAMQQKDEIKLFPDIVVDDNGLPGRKKKLFADWSVTLGGVTEIFSRFSTKKLRFLFDKETFTRDNEAPVWCRACSQVGHKRQNCPDEMMPVAEDLPPVSERDIDVLNKLCDRVCDKLKASVEEITARDSMKDELLHFIREKFPEAKLDVFGSSNNGFGSRQSDVDLCMTFADKPSGEGMDFSAMITGIGDILRRHKDVSEVNAVSMAKVPIVKFTWKKSILVDLSLYNRLGQENTKLLKAYSEIDPRVRPLVYMMKKFVKTACIGDASRGSLSSYAYTLMVLYFLQQVDPPILPVLQELSETEDPPPPKELENANVYFFSDIANLEKVWPHKKNEKTVGELWLDILDFYVSPKFHEAAKVVSIRKLDPLYKVTKMWMSTNLCIEDPFDLSHNLGSGLSRRMSVHIVRCFQRARRHFGSSCPEDCPSVEDYFFDAEKLTPGKPPCDRGCRVCGHIGHIRDECPERRVNQEQQKQRNRQANGMEKGNQRQGRKAQDNGRSTPSDKRPEQSLEKRTKPVDSKSVNSPLPRVNDRPPPASAAEPLQTAEEPSSKSKASDVAGAPKRKSLAADTTAKKAPVKTSTRREPRANPASDSKKSDSEAKTGTAKPVKSVTGVETDDGNPLPPKITKEKTRTFRNSHMKGPMKGGGQKVVLPEEKTAAKDPRNDATTSAVQAPKKKVPRKRKPKAEKGNDITVPTTVVTGRPLDG